MADVLDFHIPVNPTQLEEDSELKLCVINLDEIQEVTSLINNIRQQLERPFLITNHDVFSTVYSIFKHFETVKMDHKKEILDILADALQSTIEYLRKILLDTNNIEIRKKVSINRSAVKMYTFLISWGIREFEREHSQAQNAVTEKKDKRKKKKNDFVAEELESWKSRILATLASVAELDVKKLFHPFAPEEEFISLFFSTALSILDNVETFSSTIVSDAVKRLLLNSVNVSSDEALSGFASNIVSLVMKNEKGAHFVIDLISSATQDNPTNRQQAFTSQIFQEFSRVDNEELAQDSSGSKHLSEFLIQLSESLPKIINSNLSMIISHLSYESYNIRSAVLHSISRIITKVLLKDESEKAVSSRDHILDILKERFMDTNAYTRSKAVQCFTYLCEEQALPLSEISKVLAMVVSRLADKSAFVRKSAIQFLMSLIEHNPFGGVLKKSMYENHLTSIVKQIESVEGTEMSESQNAELLKLMRLKVYNEQAIGFIDLLNKSIPSAMKMLDSNTSTDVIECIQFFVCAYAFQLEDAFIGIKKMLKLTWSKEKSIKDAVVEAFERTFLLSKPLKDAQTCIELSLNLCNLVRMCNMQEISALESIIITSIQSDTFPDMLVKALWEIFSLNLEKAPQLTEDDSVGAAIILSILAKAKPIIAKRKFNTLVNVGLGERAGKQPYLARYTCLILENMSKNSVIVTDDSEEHEIEEDNVPIRLSPSHTVFEKLSKLISENQQQWELNHWITVSQSIVNCIFSFCTKPEMIMKNIIQTLAMKTKSFFESQQQGSVQVSSSDLCQLLWLLGHGALKELVHVESKFREIKKQKALAKEVSKQNRAKNMSAIESELGMDPLSMDDVELEEEFEQRERNIVSQDSIYGSFVPLINAICTDRNNSFKDTMLKKTVILTLCKYMCVSKEFCESYLQLLFTLLMGPKSGSKECDSIIRSNIIICVGDMARRFPNTMEPWIHHVYNCLQDKDIRVRKHTLMVLTNLILNDMIKLKTNISDIVLCVEDSNEEIVNLAKSFFTELNNKASGSSNPIFNLMPETISKLSTHTSLSDETFKNIMRYMFTFITKDRESEKLVEKLCYRFKLVTDDVLQWRDIAFCLTLVQMNEKCLKKVVECYKYYQHTLIDKEVVQTLYTLTNKIIKKPKSKEDDTELRQLLDEWEDRVDQHHKKLLEDEEYVNQISSNQPRQRRVASQPQQTSEEATSQEDSQVTQSQDSQSSQATTATNKKGRNTRSKNAKTAPKKKGGRRKKNVSSDEEDEEMQEEPALDFLDDEDDVVMQEENEDPIPATTKPTKSTKSKSTRSRKQQQPLKDITNQQVEDLMLDEEEEEVIVKRSSRRTRNTTRGVTTTEED